MSDDDHFVVRDARGRELGTIRREAPYSGPSGPFGLGGLIGTFLLITAGIWIVGGIVLTIVIQVVTKLFGSADVGTSASLGFNVAFLIGFLSAGGVVINILRQKEERKALVTQTLIAAGCVAALAVVSWAFIGR